MRHGRRPPSSHCNGRMLESVTLFMSPFIFNQIWLLSSTQVVESRTDPRGEYTERAPATPDILTAQRKSHQFVMKIRAWLRSRGWVGLGFQAQLCPGELGDGGDSLTSLCFGVRHRHSADAHAACLLLPREDSVK